MVLQRGWRIAICLLLCVCMAFACVAPVYATAILPVVAFGSLAVIAAVLVATGVMSTNDADFDGLCNDIYDSLSAASKIGPKITLSVMAGVSYLHTSIVEMIAGEAVKLGAYAPTGGSTIEVDNYSYPYYADEAAALAAYVPVVSFVKNPPAGSFPTTVVVAAPFYWDFSSYLKGHAYLRKEGEPDDCYIDSTVIPMAPWEFGSVVYIESLGNLFSFYRFGTNPVHTMALYGEHTVTGSISVSWPWELTDDLPSISSSGALDKVNAGWLARERAIDGTASLPLSVPADTVAGAAAQTQADAQAGTKTKDVAFDVVDDSAASDFVDKGKLSFSLADFFPFCIPFDIIKGIKLLVAPPKAPIFDIPIKFPYIPEQTIHVDLAQYGGIAVFSRWFLTLAFVIGLAVGTSKVMKW